MTAGSDGAATAREGDYARRRLLKPDGTLVADAKPRMDEESLLEALRWMLFSRALDERAIALQRQGRFGIFAPVMGQEATVVGSALVLDPESDWIVPAYRENAALIHHGHRLERLAAGFLGKVAQASIPEGVRLLPIQVALASQLQHAAGLAWGLKLQKLPGVVLTYVGEGGSSEGDFHEALNLAGVMGAPVVFLIQNNQWAISTPFRSQSAAASLAARAAGYGFEGIEVDGNDVLAVYDATLEAVEKARCGGGPTLIEAKTYRLSFHNTSDNPSRYLDPQELEAAKQLDPIARVERFLETLGLWGEERREKTMSEVRQEVYDAIEQAFAFPPPQASDLFDHAYAELPQRVRKQRDEVLRREG
jgi:pyruvate dehydrogenase E1 component alpha subunit